MKYLSTLLLPGVVLNTIFVFPAVGQITPDGTTNTTVNPTGNGFQINNGNVAGEQLIS